MTRHPDPDKLRDLFSRLASTHWRDIGTETIRHLARELRSGSSRPDGYPSATLTDGGGGANIVVDGDRVPVTSTEAAVFARMIEDSDAHARHTFGAIHFALSILDNLDGLHRELRALGKLEDCITPDDDQWCRHHATFRINEPVGDKGRRGLCRWCEEFERANRQLPPKALVDRRARGEKLTEAAVAAALGRVA